MAFKSLLDPAFQYRSAANTDVRETFERIRREQHVTSSRAGARKARTPALPGCPKRSRAAPAGRKDSPRRRDEESPEGKIAC